jgi:hypothetical protein
LAKEGDHEARQTREQRRETALQAARLADADEGAHEQSKVEGSGMDQEPLVDVGVPTEVCATHRTSLVEVGKWTLDLLAAQSSEPLASCTAHSATIRVDRHLPRGVTVPPSSRALGL